MKDYEYFNEGDILEPSANNLEYCDRPMPRYQIIQIGCGRIIAENLLTHETTDLSDSSDGTNVQYYYNKVSDEQKKKIMSSMPKRVYLVTIRNFSGSTQRGDCIHEVSPSQALKKYIQSIGGKSLTSIRIERYKFDSQPR